MDTILKWLQLARKNRLHATVVLFLLVVVIGFGAYLTGMFAELGRQIAMVHDPEMILVTDGTHHIGDEIRNEYPAEKEGRILEKTFGFQAKHNPRNAALLMEAFDVDLYGVKVFVNESYIGRLRIGDPWQETQLAIPSGTVTPGQNTVSVRSVTPAHGKVEDCLFRNIRVALEY